MIYNVFGDADGNAVLVKAESQIAPPAGCALVGTYDEATAPQDVLSAWEDSGAWQVVGGSLVQRPFLTLTTSTDATTTPPTVTVTATLNNPPSPAPTSVTFGLAGDSVAVTPSGDVATWTFDVHPSLNGAQATITAATAGCVSGSVTIGTTQAQVGLQVYTATSGTPTVAPVGIGSKAYLRAWAMGLTAEVQVAVLTEALQDLYVATSAVMHLFTSKIVPALTAVSYAPITLTAAEEAALTHWQANLQPQLLPLAGLLDAQGNPIAPYAEAIANAPTYQAAMTAYSTALGEIPGLE